MGNKKRILYSRHIGDDNMLRQLATYNFLKTMGAVGGVSYALAMNTILYVNNHQ